MNDTAQTQQQAIQIKTTQIPQHNTFEFKLENLDGQSEMTVVFNSDFDSGNCGRVIQKSNFEYDIFTSPDRDQGTDQEGYSKSWFYFSVKGFKKEQTIKLNIQQIHILWSLWNNKACNQYKPVYKINKDGEYQRLQTEVNIQMVAKNYLVLTFEYTFDQENSEQDEVFFCFSYPYEYQRCIDMIKKLQEDYSNDQDIYLHSEVIVQSTQQRDVHLLTISSQDGILDKQEEYFQQPLFPFREKETRAKRFRTNKPYILITCRVHPGETPSSYALEGMIKFLLNKKDSRSALLRQFFVFLIVPMLNPDGVYNGHYRMDTFNNNLNRFYKIADPQKQPSIYAIKKLVEYLQEDKRLFFYIDLHAHAGKKGHFVYGNACDDIVMQIENQTFAKILSMNCKNFEYNFCNFSKKHMKARDKFEEMTKEGCGRVQVHQITKIIHAYTLECGFHQATQLNYLPPASNAEFKINDVLGFDYDPAEDNQSEIYKGKKEPPVFVPILYQDVGKAILVTILDIFEKNPYSRIPNSSYKTIDNIRRSIGWDCARIERFRKDPLAYKKARKFNEFIQEAFFSEFERKKVFNFDSTLFKNTQWPELLLGNFLHKYVSIENSKQNNNQQNKRQNKYFQIKSRIFEKRIISCSNIEEYYTDDYNCQNNKNGFGLLSTQKDNYNTEIERLSNFNEDDENSQSQKNQVTQFEFKSIHEIEKCDIAKEDYQDNNNTSQNSHQHNKILSKSESPKKQSHHMSMICHIPPINKQNFQIQQQNINNDQVSFIFLGNQQSQHISNSEKKFYKIDEEDPIVRPNQNSLSKKKKRKNYEQYLSEITKNNNVLQLSLHKQVNGNQIQNTELFKVSKKKDQQKSIIANNINERTRQFRMSSLNGIEQQQNDLPSLNIQGIEKQFYKPSEQGMFYSKQHGLNQQLSCHNQIQLINQALNSKKLIVSQRLIDKQQIKSDAQSFISQYDSHLSSNHPSSSKLIQKRENVPQGHYKNYHSMTQYNYSSISNPKNVVQPNNNACVEEEKIIQGLNAKQSNQRSQSNLIGYLLNGNSQNLNSTSKTDLLVKNDQITHQQYLSNQQDQVEKRISLNYSNQSSQREIRSNKIIRLSDTLNLMHDQISDSPNQTDIKIFENTNYYKQTNNEGETQNLQYQSSQEKQQVKQLKIFNVMDIPQQSGPQSSFSSATNTQYGINNTQNQNKNSQIKKTLQQNQQNFYKPLNFSQNPKTILQQSTYKKKDSPTVNSVKKKNNQASKGNKIFDMIFSNNQQQSVNYSNYNKVIANQDMISLNLDNEVKQCEAISRIFQNFPGIVKQGVVKTERKQQINNINSDELNNNNSINKSRKSEGGDEHFVRQINIFSSPKKQQNQNDFKLPDLKETCKQQYTEEDLSNNKLQLTNQHKSSKY
ncbi:zinc carboxypeptidase family protein (macronuclear) [Tetrahymena thermophila SB210]|uniref:Cytosolic carboxypeptidase-like protein 5 n=1 Tax=Tetrahymena thermophila (strain SB210) TaxID=312017 RepID=I7LTC9_TETTS|nr:zinc carboxypeptidase family protein [Tetrahymena thermophila SB210]EAR85016.2 zinc carboxypeptidase family protein [Tetrahymena thermophila SB210]|eukprot:XP_001032679.2 zinc carboxypeptidase family protein [Tetrahymena thermophila SB210]